MPAGGASDWTHMVRKLLILTAALAALAPGAVSAAPVRPAQSPDYLGLARQGVAQAQSSWRDRRSGWYDERLADKDRYPLATIWGSVPLFEAIDALQLAVPSRAGRAAVDRFARGAERYFDKALRPHGGYAPYPGDRGRVKAWFDDNGWWGLGFVDAYRATRERRYLRDAQRAFAFTLGAGWDGRDGGVWWNTGHPFKAGEALASNALLGALLYRETRVPLYLSGSQALIAWANGHLWSVHDALYAKSDESAIPMPYVEGPLIDAHEVICGATGDRSYCDAAATLADRAYDRFAELNMGPQYDTIYLRTMLDYGRAAGDGRWRALAEREAARALANARDGSGFYLRSWDGSDMAAHQAVPGMLRTDAATVDLFASLAADR
jgi:uncharacterized protein YyaL (SSP411 family)